MPPRMARGLDRISDLPNEVLHHLLSLLPAQEAVRTCVLARRWRHLWRSAPRLRVAGGSEAFSTAEKVTKFLKRLLLLRDRASRLDECEFDLSGFSDLDGESVGLWIRDALICHVRVLQVCAPFFIRLTDHLVSRHLAILDFRNVYLDGSLLDFSSCPALERLKFTECDILADNILSPSLKHLSMVDCVLVRHSSAPTHISAPSIISLQLDDLKSLVTPALGSMPLLETASVNLRFFHWNCVLYFSDRCECGMLTLDDIRIRIRINVPVPVLLGGLSTATSLELGVHTLMVAFKMDMGCCPPFRRLKSLLLSDLRFDSDIRALLCFVQHTPILEELTLQLGETPKFTAEMERRNLVEQSLKLGQLKIVKVKCEMIDERVHSIVKIFSSCSICLEKVSIIKISNDQAEF